MTDDEMEKFDEKRGEAMSSFSEVRSLYLDTLSHFFSNRASGRRPSHYSQRQSSSTPTLLLCLPREGALIISNYLRFVTFPLLQGMLH